MRYYNFPLAIFSSLRADENGIIINLRDVCNEAINFAVFTEYCKRLPPGSSPYKYDAEIFQRLMVDMGFSSPDPLQAVKDWSNSTRRWLRKKVMVGIVSSTLFDFRDNAELKTEFEVIQLLAFLAVRSILGPEIGFAGYRAKQIKWNFILSRMAGFEKVVNASKLPKFIARYGSRRLRDKLIKALVERWNMKYYGLHLGKGSPPWFSFAADIDLETHAKLSKEWHKKQRNTQQ